MKRRHFFKTGIAGGAIAGAAAASAGELKQTPRQTEGPFYPAVAQKDKDFDLTQIEGRDGIAKGEIAYVSGVIRDTAGNPLEDATVDVWQANAAGRYSHPHESNTAPLDPNFQGWAIVPSGVKGEFKFKTIIPGAYPATKKWSRPPHIHFKVTKKGYRELTTQMYFPDQKLNETDRILKSHPVEEQEQLIAKTISKEPLTLQFNLVIEKA